MRTIRLAAPLILFALILAQYWKLTLLDHQYTWLNSPEAAGRVLPWWQFLASEWRAGTIPLWNPLVNGGTPVFGNEVSGGANPLNWLLFLSPLTRGEARGWMRATSLNVYFVLVHLWAALGAYRLARLLDRSRAAAVLAGLLFSADGFLGSQGLPGYLNAAAWLPWSLLFLLRARRAAAPWRDAAMAGASLGMTYLSGATNLAEWTTIAVAAFWLAAGRPRRWGVLGGLLGAALCVGALQIVPAIGVAASAPFAVRAEHSMLPEVLAGVLIPQIRPDLTPFLGIVTVTLGICGVRGNWRRGAAPWALLALLGIAFAMGMFNPFYGVLYGLLPFAALTQDPACTMAFAGLGAAMLAGMGLDVCRRGVPAGTAAVLLWVAGGLYGLILVLMALVSNDAHRYNNLGISALVALGLGIILFAWKGGYFTARWSLALVFLAAMVEISNQTAFEWPHREKGWYVANLARFSDAASFLETTLGDNRFAADPQLAPFEMGSWYGLKQVAAGAPYVLAVRAPAGATAAFQGREATVWSVKAEPRVSVRGASCGAGSGQVVRETPGRVEIEVQAGCPSVVELRQSADRWWTGMVDGRRARVRRTGAGLAVEAPAGLHHVVLQYRPVLVYAGAVSTGVGLIGFAGLAVLSSWQRLWPASKRTLPA